MGMEKKLPFWEAFTSRDDLNQFGVDALLLFALQLRFRIEDIGVVASNSLTEGSDDKKADLVYIDSEVGHAVIAQTYISQDMDKKEAPANKASDLNTAVSWLLSRPINELPQGIKPHAEELRQVIEDRAIKTINIWYVHNLPESDNVKNELITVEHRARDAIKANFATYDDIEIQALEVGIHTLEEWYRSISTPVLVSEEFTIPISGGFEISDTDWKAYVTSIPAKWLYEQFQAYKIDLYKPPDDNAKVQVRFITCNSPDTVYDIVKYNNSQNRITAPDFRSTDKIQTRLVTEFGGIPDVIYMPRRGGHEDAIKRRPNVLPSVSAGQALAAFNGDPGIAYHEKTHMWEDDNLYSRYFNSATTAKHIVFAHSLLKSVERKKIDLWNKSKANSLTEIEKRQLEFFRKRGSTFLMASAIARCLELILNVPIPNSFRIAFKSNLSPEGAVNRWSSIVEAVSVFTAPLIEGLSDGFKTREIVEKAIQTFQSLVASTRQANVTIYSEFSKDVQLSS